MWRLCSAFQTFQGAKRSRSNYYINCKEEGEETNLSGDGTATTTRERLNLHMVGTYLKQVSIQLIGITRIDEMMPNE